MDLKNGHLKGMFLIDIEICIQNVCQCTSLISGGTCMIIQGNKKKNHFHNEYKRNEISLRTLNS